MSITIRPATLADSERIARRVSSLGYPTSSAQTRRRLESILSDETYATLVASEEEEKSRTSRPAVRSRHRSAVRRRNYGIAMQSRQTDSPQACRR